MLLEARWQQDAVEWEIRDYHRWTLAPNPTLTLEQAADQVDELNLQKGIANSLQVKLDAALRLLEDGNENNDVATVNLLEAFINAVQAQRGKKISEADADNLISAAQEIIELLSDE